MRNIPAFDWCELYPERRLGYRRLVEVGQYSHLARLRVLHLLCATPPSMGVRMASALRKCGAHTATRIGSALASSLRLGSPGSPTLPMLKRRNPGRTEDHAHHNAKTWSFQLAELLTESFRNRRFHTASDSPSDGWVGCLRTYDFGHLHAREPDDNSPASICSGFCDPRGRAALRLGTGGAARGRVRGLGLNQRAGSPRAEAQDIHGAEGDADAAADARGVGVINGFLLQREAHDVNPHQTIPGALRASDAFIVGDNFVAADPELRVKVTHQVQ